MKILGFNAQWRKLIMSCVSTVSYSVLLNGRPGQVFKPSRGLRKGDSLSPYLFHIYAKGLSALLNSTKQEGHIKGLSVSKRDMSINHILFVDDITYCFFGHQKRNGVKYKTSSISMRKG